MIRSIQVPWVDFGFSSQARLGWEGKQHLHYTNLHKKYGNVVRVGAWRFSDKRTSLT